MPRSGPSLQKKAKEIDVGKCLAMVSAQVARYNLWTVNLSKLILCLSIVFCIQGGDVEWPVNGGPYNIRYSPLTQITPRECRLLKVAWTYDSHDAFKDSEMQSNPIVVDGVLYATTPKLRVVALDAATGREIWTFDPAGGSAAQRRYRHRGVTVYQGPRLLHLPQFPVRARIARPASRFRASATTAASICAKGLDRPSRTISVSASSPGVIFEDMLIMGSTVPETLPGSPGHIRAFDVNTGKLRWMFHTIPHPGEFGYETWPKEAYKISGGANAWAGLSVDAKLGMVFAATGSASFDFYGSNRIGDNLFADCVLALDARTGRSDLAFSRRSSTTSGISIFPPRLAW